MWARILTLGQAASVSKPPYTAEHETTTFPGSLPVTICKCPSHKLELDQITLSTMGRVL